MHCSKLWTFFFMASLSLSPLAMAGQFNQVLSIGAMGPTWGQLVGTDGKKHAMEDWADSPFIVLVFTCNGCPVARAYEDRIARLDTNYRSQGVSVVAVHVHKDETAEEVRRHVEERGLEFPVLHDESQQVAKSYGATTTPHVFVLDRERKIVYMGAFDDNIREADVKEHYVVDALTALLEGRPPAVAESQQFGCSIKWRSP